MRKAIAIFFASFISLYPNRGIAVSVPMAENERLESVFQTGKFADDATTAISGIIYEGTAQLRSKGYNDQADQISSDWAYRYHDFLLDSYAMKDVGDHAAIQWLYDTWKTMDTLLGTKLMQFTHLDDLWEFAYTIPVVFHCIDHVDSPEYQKHFVMFAGAVSYWVAMGVCAAALMGTPYALVCGPVGDICEVVMVRFIAPRISDKVWGKVCGT